MLNGEFQQLQSNHNPSFVILIRQRRGPLMRLQISIPQTKRVMCEIWRVHFALRIARYSIKPIQLPCVLEPEHMPYICHSKWSHDAVLISIVTFGVVEHRQMGAKCQLLVAMALLHSQVMIGPFARRQFAALCKLQKIVTVIQRGASWRNHKQMCSLVLRLCLDAVQLAVDMFLGLLLRCVTREHRKHNAIVEATQTQMECERWHLHRVMVEHSVVTRQQIL
mmetsp:Transcript_18393/g.29157  ORF Transcript_18393/g.29157 Transcript_18393/m.29157 type:complete len:222 (+) Transcript_18393:259-924(+)